MTEIDLQTIGILIAIMVPVGTAIAVIVRLQMKVNNLEKQFRDHPLFTNFNKVWQEKGFAYFLSDSLSKSRLEGEI